MEEKSAKLQTTELQMTKSQTTEPKTAEPKTAHTQDPDRLYDAVIIGGGPAGLTAALYLARARYRVLVVEKEKFGGQITITSEVVNYPGLQRTSGTELTETMRRQAQSFGAEFMLAEVTGLGLADDIKEVKTSRGSLFCFGVLLATGAHPCMVGFAGEAEFRGHGVAYCATCDGEFFTGKPVFVVGGGFAAAEESVFLTKYASHVTILIRDDDFSCAKATAEAARQNEHITVLTNTVVDEVSGDSVLRRLRYHNTKTGEETVFEASAGDTFGVFVFAGYEPATELVRGVAELDPQGYIVTDRTQNAGIPGLYAAGDLCQKPLRQVVTAVGDGALAATELERYAAAMQKKAGLHPVQPVTRIPTRPTGAVVADGKTGAPTVPGTGNSTVSQASAGDAGMRSSSSGQNPASKELLTEEMKEQLLNVFSRMERPLVLKLWLDQRPVSAELKQYMEALSALTDKLSLQVCAERAEEQPEEVPEAERPCVRVCLADGSWTGLAFHGVPGGHEFTSFVLGLYNAAGPGQSVDEASLARIKALHGAAHIRILVSLSCTMCPELVTAAQRIAAQSPAVTAEVYDLNHFPQLREQYQVMSVPCMIINDMPPVFGKKNVEQVLELLEHAEAQVG